MTTAHDPRRGPSPWGAPPQPASAPRPPLTPAKRGGALGVVLGLIAFLTVVGAGAGALYFFRPELFGAGVTTALELEKELDPNPTSPVSLDAPGKAAIVLPPGAVRAKTKLQLYRVSGLAAPPEAALGGVIDVRLGDQHAFDEPITVSIPYDTAKVQGRRGKHPNLLALTYDPAKRSWDTVPFTVDENKHLVRIETSHLSMFSTVFPAGIKPSPTARIDYVAYPYAVDFADASTAENILKGSAAAATEEGWKASMEWFGIGSALGTMGQEAAAFAEYGNAAAVLGKLNDVAGNLGIAFALVQLGLDMQKEDNKTIAVGGALKAIGMDAIGRWGTSGMKVAGVGVFMIDYSLGKFIDAAWAGRKDLWSKVFACYYKDHSRTHAQWMTRFKAIASDAKDPKAASTAIHAEIEKYAGEVWEGTGEDLAMCQHQVGATNSGSFGGLNKRMQLDLSAEYTKQLLNDLRPEFKALSEWATQQQQQHTNELLESLRALYNKKTTIEIVLKSKDDKRKLGDYPVAITVRKDQNLWQGKTDASGKWSMEVTALGYMLYGGPTEVVVTLPPGPDGKLEQRKAKLVYTPGKTRVEVALDGGAGTFEGELAGSYSGPGIDGVVAMKGPIRVVVDDSGSVSASFTMPMKFSGGHGASNMSSTVNGTFTGGKVEGTKVTAKGTVTMTMTVVTKLPGGKEDRRSFPNVSSATLDATLTGDTLEGKVGGQPGAKAIPFTATRR